MATVAGLVLGVIPLIITALQEWDTIKQPFARYKNFKDLTENFYLKLQTQDVIFRQECMILLGPLLERSSNDPDMAEEMMKNWDHEAWKDVLPEEVEAEYLGGSREHLIKIIKSLVRVLRDIVQKCYAYGILKKVHAAPHQHHPHYEQWVLTKNKLRYSFLKTGLDSQLNELREQNDAFCTISGQIQPELNVTKVRFTLALSYINGDDTMNKERPYWITIDSIFKDSIGHKTTNSQPDQTLGRHLPQWEPHQHSYIHQLLGGLLRHTQPPAFEYHTTSKISDDPATDTESTGDADIIQDNTTHVRSEKDLCNRLQRQSLQNEIVELEQSYLGYLEVPDSSCSAILYFEAKKTSSEPTQCVNLADFMTTALRNSRSGCLKTYEKLRLARQLATAVLQFHSTPILGSCFESSNIVFYSSSDDMETRRRALQAPHLNVHLRSHDAEDNKAEQDSEELVFIHNPYLFGLGIVLLELALQTQLSDLHSEYPGYQSLHLTGKVKDYVLAERITRDNLISREVGAKYKEIVRKCLACDFGHGVDLSNPLLQDTFYRDVISELNKHEKYLAKIWEA